jgi:hypothetical protein
LRDVKPNPHRFRKTDASRGTRTAPPVKKKMREFFFRHVASKDDMIVDPKRCSELLQTITSCFPASGQVQVPGSSASLPAHRPLSRQSHARSQGHAV